MGRRGVPVPYSLTFSWKPDGPIEIELAADAEEAFLAWMHLGRDAVHGLTIFDPDGKEISFLDLPRKPTPTD
jgi:hypothetical protein